MNKLLDNVVVMTTKRCKFLSLVFLIQCFTKVLLIKVLNSLLKANISFLGFRPDGQKGGFSREMPNHAPL